MLRGSRKIINNIIFAGFAIRLAFHLIRSFGELAMPHTWRQMDTLGVSLRYWLRLAYEHGGSGYFLPAVLQSGDGNGVMPMEFPFLNFIFSPFWILGPLWGKIGIYVVLALSIYFFCWKLSRTRFWFAPAFLLLPTLSYSADYIEKFMPDTLALLLVSWGSLQIARKRKCSVFFIALGLLIKPTAVIALAICLFDSRFRKSLRFQALPLILAMLPSALFYTKGMHYLESQHTGAKLLFYVSMRDPLHSLVEVLSNPAFLWDQLLNRVFMIYGFFLAFTATLFLRKRIEKIWTFAVFVTITLQFIVIASLDGSHMAQHDYYCLGIAPLASIMFYFLIRRTQKHVAYLLLIIAFGHSVELSVQNTSRSKLTGFFKTREECKLLIDRNPSLPWKTGYVFRSNTEPFPSIGLCFGERQGSEVASYGLYYREKRNEMPSNCSAIDEGDIYLVARCK